MAKIFKFILLLSFITLISQVSKAEDGRKIFVESRCYTCHSIKSESELIEKEKEAFAKAKGVELKDEDGDEGDDDKKGGDLSDVGNERDSKWLSEFVTNPKDYFKDEADCSKIAKKKQRKRFKGTEEELKTLVTYLSSLKYGKQSEETQSCLKE